jgi:hypothetical protein
MLKYQNLYGKENKKFWKHVTEEIRRIGLPIPQRFNNVIRGWIERYKKIQNPHRMLSGEEVTTAYDAEMKQWIGIDDEVAREDAARIQTAEQLAKDTAESTRLQYGFMMTDNMMKEHGEAMFRALSPDLPPDWDDHLLNEYLQEVLPPRETESAPAPSLAPSSAPITSDTPSSNTEEIIPRRGAADVTRRIRPGPPSRSVVYNQGIAAASSIGTAVTALVSAADARFERQEARLAQRDVVFDAREDIRLQLDRDRLAAELRREDSVQQLTQSVELQGTQLTQRIELQGTQLSTHFDSKFDQIMAMLQQNQQPK